LPLCHCRGSASSRNRVSEGHVYADCTRSCLRGKLFFKFSPGFGHRICHSDTDQDLLGYGRGEETKNLLVYRQPIFIFRVRDHDLLAINFIFYLGGRRLLLAGDIALKSCATKGSIGLAFASICPKATMFTTPRPTLS
jgi:hypothetical protein